MDATLKIAAIENYQLSTTKGVMESITNYDTHRELRQKWNDFLRLMIVYIFETSVEKSSQIIFY